MINSFKQYLVEEERVVYFAFGRMNPPTIGHGKLLDKLASVAGRNPYRLFLSQSNDKKDNPVEYLNKVKHVRKMFPKHARYVMINKKVKTPWDALSALYDEGFRKVIMVAGSDRVQEYDIRLNMYNGKKGAYGFYNFENGVKIVSAGQRDPDAKGAEGASGTKQREYAADNDFTGFSQGLPKTMSTGDAKRLFNDVRKGMGLKEQNEFKRHIQLQSVSETREEFVKGELYKVGEEVIVKETNQVGKVTVLGSNYVIVETSNGKTRQWLDAVEKIQEEYKYEWGTDASTKHAKKMTPGQNEGLWANMHAKRARGEKMRKKGEKGAPTPDQIKRAQNEGGMKRIATTQSNKADRMASGGKKGLETFKKKQEAQDPDIKDRKGTQPARYHTGLSKATKVARDRHFQARKPGPAPGDANAKTVPSKHTTFVRKMMGESNEHEVTVGNYTTTHFHMCGSAIKAMKKHKDVEGAEQLTRMQDQYYKFEKSFIGGKTPSAEDKAQAQKMYNDIMSLAKTAGIEDEVKPYMDEHLGSIVKGDPKPGFGRVDVSESVNINMAKKKIDREKEMDKARHDRMLDRARTKDTKQKNMQTEASFADKSKASGISVGTLKKVYQRGVAAWKTGHRPGTNPTQWGHARVNAFIRKKKQGGLNHDKDLA